MPSKLVHPTLPAFLLPLLALSCPAQTTGISTPDQTPAQAADTTIAADHYVKPSRAAAPVAAQLAQPAATPYQNSYPATGAAPQPVLIPRNGPPDPSAPIAEAAPAPTPQYAPAEDLSAASARRPIDPADGEIVLDVPTRAHELNRGTLLHVRLRENLSTKTTPQGAVFTAELLTDVGHHGEVMLPAGSLLRGHIATVHGGKRISGGASIRLRPETVSLPDGTLYRLDAQVTDVEGTQDLRVNDEGTIVLHSNPNAAAAVIGGVTATAAVTGAVVGGGVGAAVGAVAGAGVGTAVYLRRDVQADLPAGTDLIFALQQPLIVSAR